MQIIVDGLLTEFLRSGKGESILLIHGWGDAAAGLRPLQQTLAKKFDVIAPDLPGFGNTQAPPRDWSLEDYAVFLEIFLKKLEITKLAAVIGHSNGGAIAIKLALGGITNINKLVLISSAGVRTPDSLKLKATLVGTKIGKALTYPLPKSTRAKLRRKHYANIGSDMLFSEHMIGTFKKIVGEDIVEESAGVTIPTLLIYADQDKQTPPSFGRLFHQKINGSTLEIIPGAGHFVHLDETAKVVKLITEYIC